MAAPSSITSRNEGNEFVSETGMLFTGVTGFCFRTGFYLTNSGSHEIKTLVAQEQTIWNDYFLNFPSGKNFTITPGQHKFIPFDLTFVGDNTNTASSGPAISGPFSNGLFENRLTLTSFSEFNGQSDPSGVIVVNVTGQTTGFTTVSSGPNFSSDSPRYPSGFLVKTDFAGDGTQRSTLRWRHPATGYFLTQYQLEYATNINQSSITTGEWNVMNMFEVDYENVSVSDPELGPFTFKKYATCTGINQLKTRGDSTQRASDYGEYIYAPSVGLSPSTDYYYRIKSQYKDVDGAIEYESDYVYGYPVNNFNVSISNSDINLGLLSGSSTLPDDGSTDPQPIIGNTTQARPPLYIYLDNEQTNINLKSLFDAEIVDRGISLDYFNSSEANYRFTGVYFMLPETYVVGSNTQDSAAIQTGGVIEDNDGGEVDVVLELLPNSSVYGMGGKGGDGGFANIVVDEDSLSLNRKRIKISQPQITQSQNGSAGSPAIYVSDPNISLFRVKKDFSAKIYGGGGGGGSGDPYFIPKIFTLKFDEYDNISINLNKVIKDRGETEGFQYTVVNKNLDRQQRDRTVLDYRLSDIVGEMRAGVGGGGQGFGISLPGESLSENKFNIVDRQKGSILGAGQGTFAQNDLKLSEGGAGGSFGQNGISPDNLNANVLFSPLEDVEAGPSIGGQAGEAIKIISTNGNYSELTDLVYFGDYKEVTSSNFPSLLAYFNAQSETYSDDSGTTPCTNGDQLRYWKSVNDPSNIYINVADVKDTSDIADSSGPIFHDSNNAEKTNYFNGNNVLFFDGGETPGVGLKINGLVSSDGLKNDMEEFEIMYLLAPFVDYENDDIDTYAPFRRPGDQKGEFRKDKKSNKRSGAKDNGWALHQWGNIGGNEDEGYRYPSLFYTKETATNRESTGLVAGQNISFNDFTNFKNPGRPWVYSVSAKRDGQNIIYSIYNDLSLQATKVFKSSSFNWLSTPFIGFSRSGDTNGYISFYGCVSDVLVFNKSLSIEEKRSIINSLGYKFYVPSGSLTSVTTSEAATSQGNKEVKVTLSSGASDSSYPGRRIVFDNGSMFSFTRYAPASATEVWGVLTKSIPNSSNGTLYPNEFKRNTEAIKNNFAGFVIGADF